MISKRITLAVLFVISSLAALQIVFVILQGQNAERDAKALHAVLRTEQILVNPVFIANALTDLSASGFVKCVEVFREGETQAFLDLTYQGNCDLSPWLLQGAVRSVKLQALNGTKWGVNFISRNTTTFVWTVWVMRLVVVIGTILGLRWFWAYREEQEFLHQLERARADQLRDMTAQTAHDLGSPFSLLRILSQKKNLSSDELELFKTAISRSHRIVEQLRKAAKAEVHGMANGSFDLSDLLVRSTREKMIERKCLIEFSKFAIPMEMRGSETEVGRILSNIFNNALEAGGEAVLQVFTKYEDSFAEVTIQDFGIGMSSECKSLAFEKGFTTKDDGLGLGLYHAREYMQKIGGSVTLESEVDQGTRVTLRFPIG